MVVTKESDGTWQVDISHGFSKLTGNRIRHRKRGIRTKAEAEKYEAEYRIHHLHQITSKTKITIEYLYELLKEEDILRGNKRGTVDTQESYFKNYVSNFFKDADMRQLQVKDVKEFRDMLVQQPSTKGGNLANSHINQQMIFIHKLFDIAISRGFRSDNPCDSIRKLPEKHKEMSYYTPEEFKLFDSLFDSDEYHFQLIYRILMYTGLRIGEALALTWNVINLNEGYIDVLYTAYFKNSRVYIGTVKTTQSKRRIYIHKAFVEELKQWKKVQAKLLSSFTDDTDSLQIFQNTPELVTLPNVTNFKTKFKKRFPQELKVIRNHDFRHSHAAYLINTGLRNGEGKDYIFFTLMKRLGHSSITTTINVYSHLFPSQQKEVANAFDNF